MGVYKSFFKEAKEIHNIFCSYCGSKLKKESIVCSQCGAPYSNSNKSCELKEDDSIFTGNCS